MKDVSGCERVLGRLDRFLDHDLGPLEEARDAGHLEVCASCGRECAERRRWLEGVRSAILVDPEELEMAVSAVHAALGRRLAVRSAPRYRLRLLARRALVPALTAAAALLALTLLQRADLGPDLTRIASPRLPSWSVSLPGGGSLLGSDGGRAE